LLQKLTRHFATIPDIAQKCAISMLAG